MIIDGNFGLEDKLRVPTDRKWLVGTFINILSQSDIERMKSTFL